MTLSLLIIDTVEDVASLWLIVCSLALNVELSRANMIAMETALGILSAAMHFWAALAHEVQTVHEKEMR